MAYEVNFTDGTVAKLVEDGIKDSTFSITLVGKNVTTYGEVFAENFIKLLENNANTVAPSNPIKGQLWFNSSASTVSGISTKTIGVYNGIQFKPLGGANISATEPSGPSIGDLWFDTTNDQLKVYSGSAFILIGPAYSEVDGVSGPIVETVIDNVGGSHLITKIYNSDVAIPANSGVVATISKDASFALDAGSQFPGFTSTIKPGIQLSSTISNAQFHGEATSLSGFSSSDFLSAIANDTTSGTLGVINDSGLTVGVGSDFNVSVSGNDVTIANQTATGDLKFNVDSGNVITIDDTTTRALVNADPTATLGIATKGYVDTVVGPITGNAVSTSNAYADGLITTLKSGAGAGFDTFSEVETEIGNISSSSTSGLALKVAKAGDTMTGALILNADPTVALHAATKGYVDTQVSSVTPGSTTNGYGTRTVSTGAPSGGANGDIHYRY
jgi:hypothetical protein